MKTLDLVLQGSMFGLSGATFAVLSHIHAPIVLYVLAGLLAVVGGFWGWNACLESLAMNAALEEEE